MRKPKTQLILYLAGLFLLTVATILYTQNLVISGILAGSLAVMSYLGKIITDKSKQDLPAKTKAESEISTIQIKNEERCKILLFGMPSSGKTTIIENLILSGPIKTKKSTEFFDVHRLEATLRLGGPKFDVAFADYKGEDPKQITDEDNINNEPIALEFFGPAEKRQVNVVIFVVDLFPLRIPLKDKNPEGYESFLSSYKINAEAQIIERVNANLRYINEFYIRYPLEVAHSRENLFAVRLLINKTDVLKDLLARKYIRNQSMETMRQYVHNLYRIPIRALTKASREINAKNGSKIKVDFSVKLVSAIEKGKDLAEVFEDILYRYDSHKKRRQPHA